MHKDPFFTIVIPTYNRAEYVALAIQSALRQDFDSFEIIVVDDGSRDATESIVKNISDHRLKYFKKPNGERAAARNYGIKRAIGEYITFLDSDDLLKPHHLSTAKSFITRHAPDIFHLGYDIVDTTGKILYPWTPLPSPVNRKLLDGNFLSCLGVFIKCDIFSRYLFNDDRNLSGSEDYEFWLRLSSRYDILTCQKSTAQLVQHDSRSVVQINPEKLIMRIDLLRYYVSQDTVFLSKFKNGVKRWNAYLDIYIALHLSLLKNLKFQALKFAFRGITKSPSIVLSKRLWVIPIKVFFS